MEFQDSDYLVYALRQSQKLTETLKMAYKAHDHDAHPVAGMMLAGLIRESESMTELLLAVIMARNTQENKE